MTRILMVCMGNICRSPMACVVTRQLAMELGRAAEFEVDSAGTHAYHAGQRMDERASQLLHQHKYPVGKSRSRQVRPEDFDRFDLILAMDQDNLDHLQRLCPSQLQHKVKLFLSFNSTLDTGEVPDPYYGNLAGFERVLSLCEAGARALLERI